LINDGALKTPMQDAELLLVLQIEKTIEDDATQ
jgi:hypothetical protein